MKNNYDAITTTLNFINYTVGLNYESINNFLTNIVYKEDYELAIAILSKSVKVENRGVKEIIFPKFEEVVSHIDLMNGPIKEKNVNLRCITNGRYELLNIFTGIIKVISEFSKHTEWVWYNN